METVRGIIDATKDMVPDTETMCEIPSRREIKKAIASLKLGKAPGVDNISTEMLREGSETMMNILYTLFKEVWKTGIVPGDWKRGILINIPKGDNTKCGNWRGITLLSISGKMLKKRLRKEGRAFEARDHVLIISIHCVSS